MSKDATSWKPKNGLLTWGQSIELSVLQPQHSLSSRLTHNSAPDAQDLPDQGPSFSDETITLRIGSRGTGRSFCVRKDLLNSVTTFFSSTNSLRVHFPTNWTDDNPIVFDMFVDWLDHREDPRPYIPLQYTQEPWRSHAATAWVFGNKIRAAQFERYALSQFITNCATCNLSTWQYIERQAKDKSPLRRFGNHWVAWNYHLALAGQSEYNDLSAARLASVVNDDTNDPRIFDLDHWYSFCGDNINSLCIHDPVVRENAVEELFNSRRPQPEWGHDWETENKTPQEKSALAHSSSKATVSGTQNKPKLPPRPPPLPQRQNPPNLLSNKQSPMRGPSLQKTAGKA